jgi:hypothetical protein
MGVGYSPRTGGARIIQRRAIGEADDGPIPGGVPGQGHNTRRGPFASTGKETREVIISALSNPRNSFFQGKPAGQTLEEAPVVPHRPVKDHHNNPRKNHVIGS